MKKPATLNHGRLAVAEEQKMAKTKWSRFKDLVVKHPETTAYASTFVASTAAFAATTATPAAGISLYSIFGTFCAWAREEVFKPAYTKMDKVVTSVIANAGFVAASALMLTKHNVLGAAIGSAAIMGSILYKPVKEIVIDPFNSVAKKIQLLASGLVAGVGILMVAAGMSEGGIAGIFNLPLTTGQRAAVDFGLAGVGIAVAALGIMSSRKIIDNWKRDDRAKEPKSFWYVIIPINHDRKSNGFGPN